MKIDFDHYRGSNIADMIVCNLAEQADLQILESLKPVLTTESDLWVYTLETGDRYRKIEGKGISPQKALSVFCNNFRTQKV